MNKHLWRTLLIIVCAVAYGALLAWAIVPWERPVGTTLYSVRLYQEPQGVEQVQATVEEPIPGVVEPAPTVPVQEPKELPPLPQAPKSPPNTLPDANQLLLLMPTHPVAPARDDAPEPVVEIALPPQVEEPVAPNTPVQRDTPKVSITWGIPVPDIPTFTHGTAQPF